MSLMNSWCEKMFLRRCVAVAAVSSLLVLAACGGDSGTSASNNDGTSDSEEIQSSSSSTKVESSSSVILSGDSHEESSSSSSSSLKSVSSSSKQLSSSSNGKNGDGWSWDVPKEDRMNPEIAYDSMTDSRDGQIYKTVKIGDQIWMAENLNYADSIKTPSLIGKNWCYANKAENCAVTGRLYTWTAAIDSVKLATDADNPQDCGFGKECTLPDTVQGICPPGWHLPEKKEWDTLLTKVGGEATALKVLKSQTGWFRKGNGSDDVGFSALPAGDRINNGNFFDIGKLAGFWSASETDYNYAKALDLGYCSNYAALGYYNKSFGFSVRCLKD
ncbi:MAG: fibrobacter succinogenes major paralogous domain-containing protein [Fibrobacter sp.]|nr:fibrobacter succinogenes major paralogous domain-containing protein [Fibrobacter sp.]